MVSLTGKSVLTDFSEITNFKQIKKNDRAEKMFLLISMIILQRTNIFLLDQIRYFFNST